MGRPNHVRSILLALAIAALTLRAPELAFLILVGWALTECFWFCRRRGRAGRIAFAILSACIVAFVSFEAYGLYRSRILISRLEELGASHASISGRLLPGPVNYIALGEDVGDAELAAILAVDGLDNLESVVARRCKVTDEGLLSLCEFQSLSDVYISGPNITADGVEVLKRALPNCSVVYDPDD